MRVLFQIYNRRGLGHLMRGLNLARALRELVPPCEVSFYLRAAAPPGMPGNEFRCFVEKDAANGSGWPQYALDFAPDVIVYDTVLPRVPELEPDVPGVRRVYVMRRCRKERLDEIYGNAFLGQLDLILVPHTPDEFDVPTPEHLTGRTVFVGPIVRRACGEVQQTLRDRYDIRPGSFLLTSTAGGGGFGGEVDRFLDLAYRVHRKLHPTLSGLRHVVVPGPRYSKPLEALEGMTVVDVEPEMVNLLALSDLVISAGGYNTVNELRLTRTPAIFVPGVRSHDDQYERVNRLAHEGLGFVFDDPAAPQIDDRIVEICRSSRALSEIRDRYRSIPVESGNRAAAERIMELASR